MNTNGRAHNQEPNVISSFGDLAHDAIELAELQSQLFAMDVKDTSRSARTGLCLIAFGLVMLLGSVPTALVTLAIVLIEYRNWSNAAAFGMATTVGVVIAACILAGAWSVLSKSIGTLHRSREELSRNVAWLKSSLRNRGTSKVSE